MAREKITDLTSFVAQRNPGDPEGMAAAIRAGIPTGRYTTADEVANAVVYFCSALSGNITGTYLMLDGGRSGSGGAPSPSFRRAPMGGGNAAR